MKSTPNLQFLGDSPNGETLAKDANDHVELASFAASRDPEQVKFLQLEL
jgi:hypothetical protein